MSREVASSVAGASAGRADLPRAAKVSPARLAAGFDALDRAGVAWAVLRGLDEPTRSPGDVDVLVSPDDVAAARAALSGAGFVQERSWGLTPHRAFIGYDADSDAWVKLDLVAGLSYGRRGELELPGAEGVLGRRQRRGGVERLEPEDEFWTMLLHRLLDKRSIEERHRRSLAALAAERIEAMEGRASSRLARFIDGVCPAGWSPERLRAAAAAGEWEALGEAGRAISRIWRAKRRGHAAAAALWRSIARRVGWRVGPLRGGGVTVALLGPDGAGKTTLGAALRSAFPVQVRAIYMGLYKRTRPRLPPGVSLGARVSLQLLRYGLGRYHRARGRVVLFDRYTYDALVQNASGGGLKLRVHAWVLARAAPAPDLAIVLDVPAEMLFARKGERDLVTLRSQREGYRGLGAGKGVSVIDGTEPVDDCRRKAVALIWDAMAARAAGVDHGRTIHLGG